MLTRKDKVNMLMGGISSIIAIWLSKLVYLALPKKFAEYPFFGELLKMAIFVFLIIIIFSVLEFSLKYKKNK